MVLMSLDQMLDAIGDAVRDAMNEAVPKLLDKEGIAQRLSCSTQSITRLMRRGCPHLRVGDSPRFIYENVVSWLGEQNKEEGA